MIVYFDTSALVPLAVAESASPFCRRLWDEADEVITVRLLYVEAAAAMAQAMRLGRLTDRTHAGALRILDRLWGELAVVEVDDQLVRQAARLAYECGLRGYDAVHCAAAAACDAADLVVASGDGRLVEACTNLGLATANINASP